MQEYYDVDHDVDEKREQQYYSGTTECEPGPNPKKNRRKKRRSCARRYRPGWLILAQLRRNMMLPTRRTSGKPSLDAFFLMAHLNLWLSSQQSLPGFSRLLGSSHNE